MRCLSCKYDLSHLTEHRCPECGREFDPNDPHTWDVDAELRRKRLTGVLLVVLAALLVFFIAAFIPVVNNYLLTPDVQMISGPDD